MDTAEQQAIQSVGQDTWDALPSTVQHVMIHKEQELIDKETIIFEQELEIDQKEEQLFDKEYEIEQKDDLLLEKEEEILEYERLAEERRNRSVSYTYVQLKAMRVHDRIGYNY
jgi:competence protein ComGF